VEKNLLRVNSELKTQERLLSEINQLLNDLGVEPYRKGAVSNNLLIAVLLIADTESFKHSKQSDIMNKLSHYINASMIVSDAVKGEDGDISYFIKRQREVERATRKDRWILWLQQLVRWIIAVLLTVFLYSGVIWMTEDHCRDKEGNREFCVKIPIKDWIKK